MKGITCIVCPNGCSISIEKNDGGWVVKGNLCSRGRLFAINEMTNPVRSITSTVRTNFQKVPRLPVRSDKEIPLRSIFDVMKSINRVLLDHPVHTGEVILENVCSTGANIIASSDELLLEVE